jgi:hypothetical protein
MVLAGILVSLVPEMIPIFEGNGEEPGPEITGRDYVKKGIFYLTWPVGVI